VVFSSILVGVDRSEHARAALEQAIDLARAEGAAHTVVVA
jgi:nucleotide-binding universal stress UspA family protein